MGENNHAESLAPANNKEKPFQVKVMYKDGSTILKMWWLTEPYLGDVGRAIKKQIHGNK